jgi:hypothetical protein
MPSDQTAWLIERDDLATVESGGRVCLHYYGFWHEHGMHFWTPDHMKAWRFTSKECAERETNGDPLLRVAEHMWMDTRTPPASEPVPEVAEALKELDKLAFILRNEKQLPWRGDAVIQAAALLSAQAVMLEEARGCIEALLAWDKRRNFPVPYEVRDPILALLARMEAQSHVG